LHPVLVALGPLEIKSYGLMLAIAFVSGYLVAVHRARARGIDQNAVLDLSFYILLAAIAGSRAFYVLTHLAEFSPRPLAVFYIWEGGLSMMGGVLLALAVSWFFLKIRGIGFYDMADLLAPSIALGVGITRIGCFLYGCCYGLPTEACLGVHFPLDSAAGSHFHQAIHPTQLYESAYGFVFFGILMLVDRLRPPRAVLFGLFLVLYSAARFTVDFFRYYEPDQYVLSQPVALTNNQLILVALFAYGAWLVLSRLARQGKSSGGA